MLKYFRRATLSRQLAVVSCLAILLPMLLLWYTILRGQQDAANSRITAIHGEMLPRLLLAESEEEFESLWELYVYLRETNGLELVLEESTRQMESAKARLGLE